MKKSFIQLILLIISLSSLYLVYEKFFKNKFYVQEENEIINTQDSISVKNQETVIEEQNETNLISNLKYKSFDAIGNEYIINSKSA